MKNWNISYPLREGFFSIFSHSFASIATVGILVACMLLMGIFSLLAVNIDATLQGIEKNNEIVAYLDDSCDQSAIDLIESTIRATDNVREGADGVLFVSRADALNDLRSDLGDAVVDGLEDDNPLRNSFRIFPADLRLIQQTSAEIADIPGVVKTRSEQDIAAMLVNFRNVATAVALGLISILGIVSIFIVSNLVRIAAYAREKEIRIMKTVGATNSFIRFAFMVEGILLGIVSAIVGFLCIKLAYFLFFEQQNFGIPIVRIVPFPQMQPVVFLCTLLLGVLFGIGGSFLSLRKFIDT